MLLTTTEQHVTTTEIRLDSLEAVLRYPHHLNVPPCTPTITQEGLFLPAQSLAVMLRNALAKEKDEARRQRAISVLCGMLTDPEASVHVRSTLLDLIDTLDKKQRPGDPERSALAEMHSLLEEELLLPIFYAADDLTLRSVTLLLQSDTLRSAVQRMEADDAITFLLGLVPW